MPVKEKHSRLRKNKHFPEIDRKIKAGVVCEEIARWLQEDEGEFPGIQRNSVVRALYRYKEDVPANQLAISQPLYLHKKLESLNKDLNEIKELEKLYALQLSRISNAVEKEDMMKGFLNKSLRKEIELSVNILAKLLEAKVKLGIYDHAPTKYDLGVSAHQEAIADLPEEKRKRMSDLARIIVDKLKEVPALSPGQPEGQEIQEAEVEWVE